MNFQNSTEKFSDALYSREKGGSKSNGLITKLRWVDPLLLLFLFQSVFVGCLTKGTDEDTEEKLSITIFDGFGPNWSADEGGWAIAGVHGGNNWGVEQAMAFTPSVDGTLSDVWISLSYGSWHKAKEVTIKVALDENQIPGTILESWVLNAGFVKWGETGQPHHMVGTGRTNLIAGQRYWLWGVAEESTFVAWNNHIDYKFLCPHTLRQEGKDWLPVGNETCSAFRIDIAKAK